MSDLVALERCSKTYRRGPETVVALAEADLALRRGELVALVGPSGSGKSTLLNVLVGWERPDSGRVIWPGLPGDHAARGWDEVAVVPQRLGLLDELTVGENIALPLLLSGRRDRPDALVAALGLEGLTGRMPDEVSLGEQQRAAIARALVLGPALVVLDEPTGHQDEHAAKVVLEALRQAADAGTACLLATHAAEVRDVTDRVLRISDGRVG